MWQEMGTDSLTMTKGKDLKPADSWPMACFLLLLFRAHPALSTQQASQSTC